MANPAHPRWRDWRKYVGENGEKYIDANNFQYLLAGFFLSAFLNVPIIGAAIVGVALAIAFYQRAERDTELAAHASADAFIGEDE